MGEAGREPEVLVEHSPKKIQKVTASIGCNPVAWANAVLFARGKKAEKWKRGR